MTVASSKLDTFYTDLGIASHGNITKPQFINMMRQTQLTKLEAVKHDVEEGWKIYEQIQVRGSDKC